MFGLSRLARYLPKERLERIIYLMATRVLEQYPELGDLARRIGRSAQIQIYNEFGDEANIWLGVKDGEPVVSRGFHPATNTIRMHIDVFLDIVEGKIDFRQAVAHGVVEIQSHDGLPWFYHFALWASFFDKIKRLLGR